MSKKKKNKPSPTAEEWLAARKERMKAPDKLLKSIKKNMAHLQRIQESLNYHWTHEDGVYRYYHKSFKVFYRFEQPIKEAVDLFELMRPIKKWGLNSQYMAHINEGTGIEFTLEHNKDWEVHTRPILQAFFHTKFFVDMMVKYGEELDEAPMIMPSGWAAIMYLFNIR